MIILLKVLGKAVIITAACLAFAQIPIILAELYGFGVGALAGIVWLIGVAILLYRSV